MLKRLLKLLSSSQTTQPPQAAGEHENSPAKKEAPNKPRHKKKGGNKSNDQRSEHAIALPALSPNAVQVCKALQAANFQAYIVGGGIRDSLLETKPKDFDVATSATPEQVRQVFRNSRIIGRRFKIVHVRFGREIIEVTTFRDSHLTGKTHNAQQSSQGLLLRDNVYGDLESDALRRDFTINALYYDPISETLIDFTNGLADIQSRTLRIIGNASDRYREDPVRMLRAARFAAKLGFELEQNTAEPINELGELLGNIPAARLFDEVLKLMLGGSATATLNTLKQYDLFTHLFPGVAPLIEASEFNQKMIELVCLNTDKRIRQGKRVTPAFIFAVFLWLPLQNEIKRLLAEGMKAGDARNAAVGQVISEQIRRTAIPKRFTLPMRDIWYLQHALATRPGKRCFSTLEHQRFRAAYDFLLLREDAGEDFEQAGRWWTEFQFANETHQNTMIDALSAQPASSPKKRKPRRRKPKKTTSPLTSKTDNNDQPT